MVTSLPGTILTNFVVFLTPQKGPVRRMTFREELISLRGKDLKIWFDHTHHNRVYKQIIYLVPERKVIFRQNLNM